jgi:hypothetical protein
MSLTLNLRLKLAFGVKSSKSQLQFWRQKQFYLRTPKYVKKLLLLESLLSLTKVNTKCAIIIIENVLERNVWRVYC